MAYGQENRWSVRGAAIPKVSDRFSEQALYFLRSGLAHGYCQLPAVFVPDAFDKANEIAANVQLVQILCDRRSYVFGSPIRP